MILRQIRIRRIVAVAKEYEAARSAAALLEQNLAANPNFGDEFGWKRQAGRDFRQNLQATYIIRVFAEFEAALRNYWGSFLGKTSQPQMVQLLNQAIPNQRFPINCVDDANDVRKYRNFLVHEIDEEVPVDLVVLTVADAKRRLCSYLSCFDPRWK